MSSVPEKDVLIRRKENKGADCDYAFSRSLAAVIGRFFQK